MNKARLILLAIAAIALIGGTFAFKAKKFNGQPAFTYSTRYSTFNTVYTTVASVCLPINPNRFISTTGPALTTVYSSTGIMLGVTITLQREGGLETITFPLWSCTLRPNTYTTLVN